MFIIGFVIFFAVIGYGMFIAHYPQKLKKENYR
jgi:hypothetical protein